MIDETTIRPATTDHIPYLVDMMEHAHSEAGFRLDHARAAKAFGKLIDRVDFGRVWIALKNERPVGYIILTYRFSMESGGLDAHVEDLFVKPDEQRNGIGSQLVDEAISHCKEQGIMALHVETGAEDRKAIRFYAKHKLRNRGHTLLTAELLTNEMAKTE